MVSKMESLRDCHLIIDAIVEDFQIKNRYFSRWTACSTFHLIGYQYFIFVGDCSCIGTRTS